MVFLALTACALQQSASIIQTGEPASVPPPTLAPIEIPTQGHRLGDRTLQASAGCPASARHIQIREICDSPDVYCPGGWVIYCDVPGQFELALEHHDPYICVLRRDLRALAPNCAEVPQSDVGFSAADIAGWLAARDGLDTSQLCLSALVDSAVASWTCG